MATKIRSRWVEGLLEFFDAATGNIVLKLTETGIKGPIVSTVAIEKDADHTLTDAEKTHLFITLKATAASKTFTLGLADGQIALVYNHGTNAFTMKNAAGDTGTEIAAGKLFLVVGSSTANASIIIALNPDE